VPEAQPVSSGAKAPEGQPFTGLAQAHFRWLIVASSRRRWLVIIGLLYHVATPRVPRAQVQLHRNVFAGSSHVSRPTVRDDSLRMFQYSGREVERMG
jgi:hypothetical protein